AACDTVLRQTAHLSTILHTGILLEEEISGEMTEFYREAHAAVSSISQAEIRTRLPPLASLAKDWGICIPLDPKIPSLPLLVAFAAFDHQTDYDLEFSRSFSQNELTVTFHIRPGASKEVLLAQFDSVLKNFAPPRPPTSKTPKRQQKELSYYELMFRAY